MDKLGLRTTADLTQYAIKAGLIAIEIPGSEGVIEDSVSTRSKATGVANVTPSLLQFGGARASRMNAG
jgi:hypothetical protein